jgi:hypothetical protein
MELLLFGRVPVSSGSDDSIRILVYKYLLDERLKLTIDLGW